MADQVQRSRSVYIGNLPWDVKEDELKKIFSQVGTIVSLRMPVDPETQRSRGFAFCEFREQESVNVAIKHFNAYELNGRKIRVDSAANNADKDSKVTGPFFSENQYGEACDPVKAPEIIANAIGTMSPQQISTLISEAKRCLQGDPQEARLALVNNPQVTYALLLALVRGRYISKERGTEALVKPEAPLLLPLFPDTRGAPQHLGVPMQPMHIPQQMPQMPQMHGIQTIGGSAMPQMYVPPVPVMSGPPLRPYSDHSQIPRHYQEPGPPPMRMPFPDAQGGPFQRQPNIPLERPPPPRNFNGSHQERPDLSQRRVAAENTRDRRGADRPSRFEQVDRSPGSHRSPQISTNATPPPSSLPVSASRDEQEKAELIMQVLKLREEDIAKMAPEQQKTVRTLRDQFKSINK